MGVRYNKELVSKDRRVTTRGPRDLQQRHRAPAPVAPADVEELKERIVALSSSLEQRPSNTEGLYTADQVNAEILKSITAETAQLKLEHERQVSELKVQIIHLENEVNSLRDKLTKSEQALSVAKQDAEAQAAKYANDVKAKYDDLLENRNLKIKSLTDTHKTEVDSLTSRIKSQDEIIANLRESKSTGISEEKLRELLASVANNSVTAEVASDRPQMETSFVDPLERDISKLEHKIVVEDVSVSRKDEMVNKVNKLKGLMGSLPPKRPI